MRTLRRPMFRMGGSTGEGLTSGLTPRQGYDEAGPVKSLDDMYLSDTKGLSIGELQRISRMSRPKETYKDRDDFLINLGLDMVSRSPSSNIISTIGESAKDPFKQYQAGKASRDKIQSESEADMFKTLIGAQAKTLSSEGAGKGWLKQWEFEKIGELNKLIDTLSSKGNLTKEEQLQLKTAQDQRSQIVELDEVTKNRLKNNKYLVDDEIDRLFIEDQQKEPEARRYKTKKDLQLEIDAMNALRKRFGAAEGGRIGYQEGMTAMPAAGDMMQATSNMGPQDDSAPEELTNELTFEELRQRLPQEIGDDIINLILSSAEAMEDFATIQTEQDIANFNKKYGVNLILPSEG